MATLGHTPNLFAVELEELRMERDWTYLELSEAIAIATNKRRDEDCWRRICQGITTQPHGRTLNIINKFLATQRAAGARKRRPAPARKAS